MKSRTALITGSTSGIGAAMATAFAAEGANIVINGLGDAAEIEKVRAALEAKHGVPVLYNAADMTKPEEIEDLIQTAEDRFGSVDILVNNAGIQHTASIGEFPVDRWNAVIAINLSAAFHAMRAALPGMQKRGWGRIINMASAHGLVASVNKSAYVAAKHGIVGLTKVAALENSRTGVTCNAICPGWVKTPLVIAQIEARATANGTGIDEETQALLLEKQPSGKFTTVEQIAATAVFLCGDAASNMTGTTITLDGGWTAQ
jgi:3-hydroxybutyrate dehydrogenase